MKGAALALALAASTLAAAQMDHAIGGKRADRFHTSTYDPKQKLYLFSGGD